MLLLLMLLPNEFLIPGLICAAIYFIVIPAVKTELANRNLSKWNVTPKDLVILHGTPRISNLVPHPSPFFVKLETYLKVAKIPYKVDTSYQNKNGPKGKFPWITINGQHIGDTELIIQYLNKKFNVALNTHLSKEQLATASTIRVMLEEHLFWGVSLYRYVYGSFNNYKRFVGEDSNKSNNGLDDWKTWIIWKYMARTKLANAKAMGLGLHSQAEVEQLTLSDLKYISSVLGSNKYITGDQPCEHDCGIFGQLFQALWASPGSVYEKAINDEFPNLKEYCERIRSEFYPDWTDLHYLISKNKCD